MRKGGVGTRTRISLTCLPALPMMTDASWVTMRHRIWICWVTWASASWGGCSEGGGGAGRPAALEEGEE